MRVSVLVLICAVVVLVPLGVWWLGRTDALLRVAGVDPRYVQTVPDRVRYTSMGAIVLLTATAATASLTVALSLVFTARDWPFYLPVGMLWGGIVLNFDRWIVSSLDYGPLTAEDAAQARPPRTWSKVVHFAVRFTMSALVGLVISEPIVLAIFGPEISQQLAAQHVTDISQQTAQINAAAAKQLAIINQPVTAARNALRAATRKASEAHKIYLCELTAQCHNLPPGVVTGVPGLGPQTTQDYQIWRADVRLQDKAQRTADSAAARARGQAAALSQQTAGKIAVATKKIDADNGLLARERALDTLSRQNSGFLLRRLLLWLALMFIDLAPVLLKTFSPGTVYDVLQRNAAVRLARNSHTDAVADGDHESRKRAISRDWDLRYHHAESESGYRQRVGTLGPGPWLADAMPPPGLTGTMNGTVAAGTVAADTVAAGNGAVGNRATGAVGNGAVGNGATGAVGNGAVGNGATGAVGNGRTGLGVTGLRAPGNGVTGHSAGAVGTAAVAGNGWVIGNRWQIQRPLTDAPHSGRVPFVAVDLHREHLSEVVVKIIAPPPGALGSRALREQRHAQMEMSLPLGPVHGNIAEVLDCDLDVQYGCYIVTRLYPMSLERYLRAAAEQDTLTIGQVLDFAVQILAGLRAAWDLGLVHLDLKPANVALTEDGQVKLIDFGLAQQYQRAGGGNDTTTAARFTPFYAPPEQMARQPGWISRNADVRALGAVVYRMLTGYPPLYREARALGLIDSSGQYESSPDIRNLIAAVEPVPVRDLIGYVPEDLDMLVRQWLRTDPQMRCPGSPHTMGERIWAQLAAVRARADGQPEAGFLVGPRVTREPRSARLRGQWQPGPPSGGAGPPSGGADPVVTHDGPAGHGGVLDFQTVPEAPGPAARPEAHGHRDEEEPV
jgi:serine/threonine protein kinase